MRRVEPPGSVGLAWAAHVPSLRPVVRRHPVAAFLVLLYGMAGGLALIPALTEPGLLPNDANLYGPLVSILGCAVPAVVVTAIVGGRAAVDALIRRCLRWRVPVRWYVVALLGMPVLTLVGAVAFYGLAPLGALAANWELLLTSFLPTMALMILLYNVTEELGFTGFLFARLQDRHGPMRAALATAVFFWLFHLPGFVVDTGSLALAGLAMAVVLLPHVASRLIVGWLYNASGASVLIAGLFHAAFNATVNPPGFAIAVLDLPPDEAFVILNAIVVVAGVTVALATKRRLGLSTGVPSGTRPA